MNRFMHCTEPCNLAQAIAESDGETIKALYMSGELIPVSPLLRRCPSGLTAKQAVILAALSTRQGIITSHAETAALLNDMWCIVTTRVAMREQSDKLNARGFFAECRAAYEGILQGKSYIFSAKCCPFLVLPSTLPHTPASTPAHTADVPQAQAAPSTPASAPTPGETQPPPLSPTSAPLLPREENEEEKSRSFSFQEKTVQPELTQDFFAEAEKGYAAKWPHVLRVGFDFPTFVNAANKAPNKKLLLMSWRQSLDYAEFDLMHNAPLKKPDGTRIDSPRSWIFGCFVRSSAYPPPRNYRTPEELAQEEARKAALEKEKRLCAAAYAEWRKTVPEDELRRLFSDWQMRFSPPENVIEERFQKRIWPELLKQKMPLEGLKQAMVSYDETACPAGPKTNDSPSSS